MLYLLTTISSHLDCFKVDLYHEITKLSGSFTSSHILLTHNLLSENFAYPPLLNTTYKSSMHP